MPASPMTASQPDQRPADHPSATSGKIGVLLANLGTPDNYDYWSMRRYLNEFLSSHDLVKCHLQYKQNSPQN